MSEATNQNAGSANSQLHEVQPAQNLQTTSQYHHNEDVTMTDHQRSSQIYSTHQTTTN